jgi:flagellar motor switch protein FliN/FliY
MSVNEVNYRELTEVEPLGSVALLPNLDMLKHVNVTLEVKIGQAVLSVAELFQLKSGSVLVLDREVEEPVDILLNGKPIAAGYLAVSGEHLGVRVTEIRNEATALTP